MLSKDGELLHLALVADLEPDANHAAVYLHVKNVDAWNSSWSAPGVDLSDIRDEPWDMREFSVTDPSGNLIRVGQNR